MQIDKAIVILTNFFDAEKVINDHSVLCDNPIRIVKFHPDRLHVLSIALSHPKFDRLPMVDKYFESRLDFFCPTYDLLLKYKQDGDWEHYTKKYKSIIIQRKDRIKEWFDSLVSDHVYILCCWENTSGKSHCHRQLLYQAFLKSEVAKKYMTPLYRNGERINVNEVKKEENDEEGF
jgi:hypothetical protein